MQACKSRAGGRACRRANPGRVGEQAGAQTSDRDSAEAVDGHVGGQACGRKMDRQASVQASVQAGRYAGGIVAAQRRQTGGRAGE